MSRGDLQPCPLSGTVRCLQLSVSQPTQLLSSLLRIWRTETFGSTLKSSALFICHLLSFLGDTGDIFELIFVFILCVVLKFLILKRLRKKVFMSMIKQLLFFSGSTCVTQCRRWDQIHWVDGDQWPFDGKLLSRYVKWLINYDRPYSIKI